MTRYDSYSAQGRMMLLGRTWAVTVWFDRFEGDCEITEVELEGIFQEDSDLESGNYASFNHSVLLDVTELSPKEQMAAYEIADYNFERDTEHE